MCSGCIVDDGKIDKLEIMIRLDLSRSKSSSRQIVGLGRKESPARELKRNNRMRFNEFFSYASVWDRRTATVIGAVSGLCYVHRIGFPPRRGPALRLSAIGQKVRGKAVVEIPIQRRRQRSRRRCSWESFDLCVSRALPRPCGQWRRRGRRHALRLPQHRRGLTILARADRPDESDGRTRARG